MSAVRSPYTRTAWFYRNGRIEPGRDHILCQVDEEKHTKRRQQMAAGVRALFVSYPSKLIDGDSILAKKTPILSSQ